MEKPRRSIEENKRISITTIVILLITLIAGLFLIIYFLFSKAENNKKIESANNEIDMLTLDTNNENEITQELNTLLSSVSNPSTYINIQKENYKSLLPTIEEKIKDYSTNEKIAYLVFVVDRADNLDLAIESLNNNKVLATFFTSTKESADKINENGQLIGLYITDPNKAENAKEEYKDIIDAYNPDLFMLPPALKDSDIKINSFYKVVENSTSEEKRLLNQEGYINDIVETTADRDFLIIRINLSNSVGVNSINGIISKLKDKNYIFLPLISSSSLIEK